MTNRGENTEEVSRANRPSLRDAGKTSVNLCVRDKADAATWNTHSRSRRRKRGEVEPKASESGRKISLKTVRKGGKNDA